MKIIKILFIIVIALCLLVFIGAPILLKTFGADQYLFQIANKAALSLGRSVSFENLGFGISRQGFSLDAGPLVISDDPSFTSQPFIKIDHVRVYPNLIKLVLNHEIVINSILLKSSQIHFIRNEDGVLNVRSIFQASHPNIPKNTENVSTTISIPQSFSKDKLEVNIKSLTVEDADISFIDQSQTYPKDIWLTGVEAKSDDFLLLKRSVQINGFNMHADLTRMDMKLFNGISSQIPDTSFLKNMVGIVQLNLDHVEVPTLGNANASGEIFISGVVIKDFNIIKTVFSQALGSFSGSVEGLLNGSLKDKLGPPDTNIEKAEIKFAFHDKVLDISDSTIQTNMLEFNAKGSMDEGFNLNMDTMLHVNNDISSVLVGELDGLRYLCDDSKRITIGASLSGEITHLKYKPNKDFRKKSKRFLIEEGGGILGLLFK